MPSWMSGEHAFRIAVALVSLILLANWVLRLSGSAIEYDAQQNVAMAYNLATHGTLSLDTSSDQTADVTPTRYREPLPPAVAALWIKALETVRGPFPYAYVESGPGALVVKSTNLLWGIIICLSVYGALRVFTLSDALALLGAFIAGLTMRVDWLYSEPVAQALLALFSFLFMLAVSHQKYRYWVLAGLCLGALILTKASFLYVTFGLAACIVAVMAYQAVKAQLTIRLVAAFVLFTLSVSVTVAPWMLRNYYHFGSVEITDRSGAVLSVRALENQVTWDEYVGAIYVWAPRGTFDAIGWLMGLSEADLAPGGALQRLNRNLPGGLEAELAGTPEATESFFRKSRAHRTELVREFAQSSDPHPKASADAQLRKDAVRQILANPCGAFLDDPAVSVAGRAVHDHRIMYCGRVRRQVPAI